MLFIATFRSSYYPEDNRVLGIFSSKEKAQHAIDDYIRTDKNIYPNYPARDAQKSYNYEIQETEIDSGEVLYA